MSQLVFLIIVLALQEFCVVSLLVKPIHQKLGRTRSVWLGLVFGKDANLGKKLLKFSIVLDAKKPPSKAPETKETEYIAKLTTSGKP